MACSNTTSRAGNHPKSILRTKYKTHVSDLGTESQLSGRKPDLDREPAIGRRISEMFMLSQYAFTHLVVSDNKKRYGDDEIRFETQIGYIKGRGEI